ncbi:cysteine desulfurase NifS [Natranaerofaba carboxydovora]|uniref:cysteine desulfurase NifS n=1 Tax=Natranaerofaba carboxydovora TaxID=2742683 RepID=UPI001F144D4B|nr:cysteine desulfurase NifS [Natranaerofaba carboxydovora]UMZ74892.1 Cysteine desulfurase IscS [Natranaerofaba carboxydovora]
MRKVYLDHGATTPMRDEVFEAMKPFLKDNFGNPSSLHSFGREMKKHVDDAREKVAVALGAKPEEIVFTSGGTESDNIAIQGVARRLKNKGNHIITSQIEHHAALDACKALEDEGFEVTYLPVDENGMVSPSDLKDAITDQTILVTIMHANNEVGTIQPIKELSEIAKEKDITFHTDAVQTVGNYPLDVNDLGVDLLSLSGHKLNGPKGIGALYVKKGTKVKRITHGGSQEKKLRPGTENVPAIIGLGVAIELAVKEVNEKVEKYACLRDKLIDGILKIEDVKLNGHPTKRLPGNVNVSIDYVEGESLLLNLDMKGIAGSSGSACTSGSLEPSHVLKAMGLDHQSAHGSLRFTIGRGNNEEDIDYVLEVLPEIVSRLREMSSVWKGKEAAEKKN